MDLKDIQYIAIRLDDESKNELKRLLTEKFGHKYPNIYCDHLTLAFGAGMTEDHLGLIGSDAMLTVVSVAYDDRCVCVPIYGLEDEYMCANDNPHITLATANGTKPVYSNRLLDSADKTEDDIDTIFLTGTVRAYPKKPRF